MITKEDPTLRGNGRATKDTKKGQRMEEVEKRPQGKDKGPQEDTNTRAPWEIGPHRKKQRGRSLRYGRQKDPKPRGRTKDPDRKRQRDKNDGRQEAAEPDPEEAWKMEGQEPSGPEKEETVEGSGGQASVQEGQPTIWTAAAEDGRTEI